MSGTGPKPPEYGNSRPNDGADQSVQKESLKCLDLTLNLLLLLESFARELVLKNAQLLLQNQEATMLPRTSTLAFDHGLASPM